MNSPENQAGLPSETAKNVQAGLLRSGKMSRWPEGEPGKKKYQTRNWSFFFFFRIMRQAEMHETQTRLRSVLVRGDQAAEGNFVADKMGLATSKAKMDLAYPRSLNGGLVSQATRGEEGYEPAPTSAAAGAEAGAAGAGAPAALAPRPSAALPKIAPDAPTPAFLNWLNVLVRGDGAKLKQGAWEFARELAKVPKPAKPAKPAASELDLRPEGVARMAQKLALDFHSSRLGSTLEAALNIGKILTHINKDYPGVMAGIRDTIDAPADGSPHGPLARMILYELLRQGAPLFADGKVLPVLRAEADEADRFKEPEPIDRTPITMTFSFAGLKALKIHEDTLASFPDAFKQGMAARARRLGDTGRNAPEHWEGELGLPGVHGYFTGASNLQGKQLSERFWKALRDEIRQFNDPNVDRGSDLRAWIGMIFRLVGLEIVHIELGQDPYEVDRGEAPEGRIRHLTERKEHFGFRDGLSQPFVDMGLGDTLPGGGTADRRGTWSPVAPGEIFLDREDESGQKHRLPLNDDLRLGSTYLVFRKLEQDVEGFRAFLEQQRPDEKKAQRKLAAQFFGRWPNGTSLVHSPHVERSTAGAETEKGLNDFRYAEDDPQGRKCPLGAHVRRSNPRDMGGRNDVRHHRILRRGIAYGGSLLAENSPVDGEKRGILFVAANARIDLQFEVVQGDWLNRGEFLGQAGLGRCPISGANDGSVRARFLEAGAVAPVTGLPNFVTMRGGDYFFAPGLTALRKIADSDSFPSSVMDLPFRLHTIDDVATPSLFSEGRLKDYWSNGLGKGEVIRVKSANPDVLPDLPSDNVAFVGWYSQVKEVLSNKVAPGGKKVHFSVEPYCTAGRLITRGEDFLIGTDAAGSPSRTRLLQVLEAGWQMLRSQWGGADKVREAARTRLEAALRRTAGARRIDLVDDLAVQASYGVLEKVYGIRGPAWLTELAGALPFSRQHVGDLPMDWIAALKGERPTDPGLKTMQVWSTFLVADLIGNSINQQALHAVGRQAGSEMLNHIDQTLAETGARLMEAAARGVRAGPSTLIEAFLVNLRLIGAQLAGPEEGRSELAKSYGKEGERWKDVYLKDVAIILLEILGSTLAVIPLTFGSVMTKLLELRIDLSLLLPRLDEKEGAKHIVYEAERLNPNSAVRMRRCMAAVDDKRLSAIQPGDFVAALISKANMDKKVFWKPERFHLGQSDPMADYLARFVGSKEAGPRDLNNYLLFGVEGSNKICWGRDHVAMPVLEECIYACGRLQGLRGVAGTLGEPQKLGTVIIGLPARFNRISSKDLRTPKDTQAT